MYEQDDRNNVSADDSEIDSSGLGVGSEEALEEMLDNEIEEEDEEDEIESECAGDGDPGEVLTPGINPPPDVASVLDQIAEADRSREDNTDDDDFDC